MRLIVTGDFNERFTRSGPMFKSLHSRELKWPAPALRLRDGVLLEEMPFSCCAGPWAKAPLYRVEDYPDRGDYVLSSLPFAEGEHHQRGADLNRIPLGRRQLLDDARHGTPDLDIDFIGLNDRDDLVHSDWIAHRLD